KGPKRLLFTPGALAHAHRRYEQTESSLEDIAIDLGVVRNTVRDIARREGWVRYVPPARGLTRTVLNTQAIDLAAQMFATQRALAQAGQSADDRNGSPNIHSSAAPPELTETVERLYRAVLEELAAAEALRAQLGSDPQSPQHAERTARILSSLTETLQKLQRL